MEDIANPTAPFLSHCEAGSDDDHPPLDETIERWVGEFTWAQLTQSVLISFAWFFDAQQLFVSALTDKQTSWHCTQRGLGDGSCSPSLISTCNISKLSWAWDWPIYTSTISEWGLECSGSIIMGLPASSFYMGCLVGGFTLSSFGDTSLGRKNMLFLASFMISLSSFATVFSTNIWVYSVLRFLSGFGRSNLGASALVLTTELVGKRWRSQVAILGFFGSTIGFLSLPLVAYLCRGSTWRIMYLWVSIPTFFYSILVCFYVFESPRWLFVKGREEEAFETLKKLASQKATNKNVMFLSLSSMSFEKKPVAAMVMKKIIEKKWAFWRLMTTMVAGFGCGMAYYGMPLALGNLGFNLYLGLVFNAVAEVPAIMLTLFLIERTSRKSALLFFCMLSCFCSILCVLAQKGWRMGFELVSFFSVDAAFNVLMIYTVELFPTCVRNTAISMVRQALVFGGVFSPVLAAAGRGDKGFLSYGVFGFMTGFCALFLMFLPETRGVRLSDTMEEEEQKVRS